MSEIKFSHTHIGHCFDCSGQIGAFQNYVEYPEYEAVYHAGCDPTPDPLKCRWCGVEIDSGGECAEHYKIRLQWQFILNPLALNLFPPPVPRGFR